MRANGTASLNPHWLRSLVLLKSFLTLFAKQQEVNSNQILVGLAGVLILCSAACKSGELDRASALSSLQAHSFGDSTAYMSTGSDMSNMDRFMSFGFLEQAGILRCSSTIEIVTRCRPTPNSGIDGPDKAGNLTFVVGTWIPTEVTGITKIDANSAVAEVRMSLRASSLYAKHRRELDDVAKWVVDFRKTQEGPYGGSFPRLGQETTRDQVIRVALRRYDDGWRVEGVQ